MIDTCISRLDYIISYVSERNAIHTKKLKKNLPGLGKIYKARAEEFLGKYEALLIEKRKTLDFAIDCYLRMLDDITMETLRFLETGQYSSSSFEEVNRRVYGNPEVMEYYMHGLLLSQFLWKHHYEMFSFFLDELTQRKSVIRNYLEIGGGHGLQVAEAARLLDWGAKLTVVDISPTSLDIARQLVADERVNFTLSDIFQYCPEHRFDFITLGEVLEHMQDPGALLKCASNLLRDGGTLFITTPANAPAIDHIYLFRNADDIRQLIRDARLTVQSEFCRYAEDVDKETAERYKITLHYGACLSRGL